MAAPAIDAEVLVLLACPAPTCRGELAQEQDRLCCRRCGRRYPIQERWPVLIPEEAETGAAGRKDD